MLNIIQKIRGRYKFPNPAMCLQSSCFYPQSALPFSSLHGFHQYSLRTCGAYDTDVRANEEPGPGPGLLTDLRGTQVNSGGKVFRVKRPALAKAQGCEAAWRVRREWRVEYEGRSDNQMTGKIGRNQKCKCTDV